MYRFWGPLIFGLCGTGILLSLGAWQMQRLAWKEDILTQIASRLTESPEQLPPEPMPVRDTYLPVRVEGTLSATTIRVLASQKRIGAGYRLISPFQVDDRVVLLDRGFIGINASMPSARDRDITVIGNLNWPSETDAFTPPPDKKTGLWFARDVPALAKELGTEPVLIVARDITPGETNITPLPVDPSRVPNDHLEYALTWFSLAMIWIIMTLWYMRRASKAA